MKIMINDEEEAEFKNWFDKITAYFLAYVVLFLYRLGCWLFGKNEMDTRLAEDGIFHRSTKEKSGIYWEGQQHE
jgi:hypothetical protein